MARISGSLRVAHCGAETAAAQGESGRLSSGSCFQLLAGGGESDASNNWLTNSRKRFGASNHRLLSFVRGQTLPRTLGIKMVECRRREGGMGVKEAWRESGIMVEG